MKEVCEAIKGFGIEVKEEMICEENYLNYVMSNGGTGYDSLKSQLYIDIVTTAKHLVYSNTGDDERAHYLYYNYKAPWEMDKQVSKEDVLQDLIKISNMFFYSDYQEGWIRENAREIEDVAIYVVSENNDSEKYNVALDELICNDKV